MTSATAARTIAPPKKRWRTVTKPGRAATEATREPGLAVLSDAERASLTGLASRTARAARAANRRAEGRELDNREVEALHRTWEALTALCVDLADNGALDSTFSLPTLERAQQLTLARSLAMVEAYDPASKKARPRSSTEVHLGEYCRGLADKVAQLARLEEPVPDSAIETARLLRRLSSASLAQLSSSGESSGHLRSET